MQISVLCRKAIVLTLAIVLLVFGILSVSYSQVQLQLDENSYPEIEEQVLSSKQIRDKMLRSVIWIQRNDGGEATGVLINKSLQLAVTNAHVTEGKERVVVFFPVRDRNGTVIGDRDFYLNPENYGVLKRMGYVTGARVIAEDHKTDLALIRLDAVAEAFKEIDYKSGFSIQFQGDPLYIIGNPDGRPLFRPKVGIFQKSTSNGLLIESDVYFGNSGGPVVNTSGKLIGIISKTNLETMETWVVPTEFINNLIDTLRPVDVFSVTNNTPFTMKYYYRWYENAEWELISLQPDEYALTWSDSKSEGFPKIRFDSSTNEGFTPVVYNLETYSQRFGLDIEDRISLKADAREYHFGYNRKSKEIKLYDSE